MEIRRAVAWLGAGCALSLGAARADAAGPWVDRSITLPHGDWAFDFGLGVAHVPRTLGPGFNLEAAVGVTRGLELGFRTGLRFDAAARGDGPSGADAYGRMFDTETYGTGNDVVANPEFRVRGALVQGNVVELGVEGRAYAGFSRGFGFMAAVPLTFHFGRVARLDTGVYVPVLFYDPTDTLVSIPVHLWFQAGHRLWLGPMSGVRVQSFRGDPDLTPWRRSDTTVPLGFGLGYAVTRAVDFKTQFLFLDVSHGSSELYGFGAGLQVRAE